MWIEYGLNQAEQWLNRLLQADPTSVINSQALTNRRLLIRFTGLVNQQLQLDFHFHTISLTLIPRYQPTDFDAEMIFGLPALYALIRHQPLAELITQRLITVRGDADVLERVRTLFTELTFDWHAPLSDLIGLELAQLIILAGQRTKRNLVRNCHQLATDFTDFLTEQKPLLLNQLQLINARQQIQQLELITGRLEQRFSACQRSYQLTHGERL